MEKEQGNRGSPTRFGFYKDIWFIYAVNEALHPWQMDMDGGCVGFVNLMYSNKNISKINKSFYEFLYSKQFFIM